VRIADLRSLAWLLRDNREALISATSRDYGQCAEFETLFGEHWVALQSIGAAIRQLRGVSLAVPQQSSVDAVGQEACSLAG
jgi:coniferyl-aldehyde dehydrogenase